MAAAAWVAGERNGGDRIGRTLANFPFCLVLSFKIQQEIFESQLRSDQAFVQIKTHTRALKCHTFVNGRWLAHRFSGC